MQLNRTSGALGPLRLHHAARIVRDLEANRKLIEDVLGIPLVATWCESVENPEAPDRQIELCHTFFQIGDGGALAFFQFASEEDHKNYAPKWGTLTGRFDHTALKVTKEGYDDLLRRVKAAGVQYAEVDHGYCEALYVPSDQGFMLEFTCDPPDADAIAAAKAKTAHADLRRWLDGERRPNNDIRHHH